MRSHFTRTLIAAVLMAGATLAHAADKQTVRPEVGKPLQEAQTLIQQKSYKDALGKIDEAEKVGSLTPYESYIVDRMRAAAATGANDINTALKAYEESLASPQMPAAEKVQTLDVMAKLAYAGKNYAKAVDAIEKYREAGGNSPQTLELLPQAYYLTGKYGEAGKELSVLLAQKEKAGQTPSETQFQLLASCALKQNDMAGYASALEKLVSYYPKPSYWLDLIARTAGSKGFSDRWSLDLYRLRYATGTLESAGDYMEAAQLALQAGFPGEADQYVKAGYAKNALGQGSDAARHKRLKDLIDKKIAEDKATLAEGEKAAAKQAAGDALVNTGLNYVGYQQYDKGLPLMTQGIAKGSLKAADAAQLHLGYAYLEAGKKEEAAKALRAVQSSDGGTAVARLWLIKAR
ncbi:hypothetical protein SAMN04488038_103129 [Solimonas aquatica]|uniref:Tetratricopeptide repeat-containing protein n=1 Tax=Solimonas aquatica TaxID=489703 RepID=A0A1H9CP82_9GAMM|nr:hypothetical protein [Solimonas aquatica]SEQ03022.1 hypothetical protein SAMN04488038_103129 [Solimonas aquatica]